MSIQLHSYHSSEEIEEEVFQTHQRSLQKALLHQSDFLALVTSIVGFTDPIQSHVPLTVVGLLVGAVQDEHIEPLKDTEELVNHEDFEVEEHPQGWIILGRKELVDDGSVPEEKVGGEGH